MPKMKVKSAAKKRFKKVGNGKIKRGKAFRRHLLNHKTTKSKRQLRKGAYIAACDLRNVADLLR
jgi:large subunit ribosomal protein L35